MALRNSPQNKRVFEVVNQWKNCALKSDDSLFTPGKRIWSTNNLENLVEKFVENPDESSDKTFFEKFREQLKDANDETIQLAAEILTIYLIVAWQITKEKKVESVNLVLSWMKNPVKVPDYINLAFTKGLINPGTAYNSYRYYYLTQIINFMIDWKSLSKGEQSKLLSDPWAFKEFVNRDQVKAAVGQRNILNYFVHPESFEDITSENHKRKIVDSFSNYLTENNQDIDKQILNIRNNLENEIGYQFHWYHPPIRNKWLDSTKNISYWVEKTIVKGRPDRQEGDYKVGSMLWSPSKSESGGDIYKNMREVKIGDVILHLTDNKGISGVSIVANFYDSEFIGLENTEWAGRPGYQVPLIGYKELEPMFDRSLFLGNEKYKEVLKSINTKYEGLFYNKDLDLNQGKYLTEAPKELVGLLNKIYEENFGKKLPYIDMGELTERKSKFLEIEEPDNSEKTYGLDDALNDLFIDRVSLESILTLWKSKKNLIIQGPPGTGKSYMAKKVAYCLLGEKSESRIEMIQFHQSYSYEDFIQGYRPKNGEFILQSGLFYDFVNKAIENENDNYVFIIDEINRGNLSKIFGEIMLLIEGDKRGEEWQISLTYSEDEKFYIPKNIYLLGLMNTADRSLSMVDYALRRRFSFYTANPQIGSEKFKKYLHDKGVDSILIDKIVNKVSDLNMVIAKDNLNLGHGYCIGHSFFCTEDPDNRYDESWYRRIIISEIAPLLEEYWFDNLEFAKNQVENLLS